ncbi:MAG: ABC transporter ATP-binding protein [bacterium]|nr:ABC transporter ATP-binding protein [bacterium]MCP4963754.1 ABC transporter ATP-binding protein [bacterium]
MTPPLILENLTKYYGSVRGVEDLNLEVRQGEIFGFLGPNGAGKSTTISTVLDFIRPTRGSATILGMDSRNKSVEIHRLVGYLPGELAMNDRMTGGELLGYLAALRGIDASKEIASLASRFDLDLSRRIRAYSSGNRQKVGLVQAFMHRPQLLILDEPTNGLDPIVQQEFYALLHEVSAEGRTVFLSSHVLPEVERITDRAAIIRQGRLMVVADIEQLKKTTQRRLEITFADPIDVSAFESLDTAQTVQISDDGYTLTVTVTGAVDPVIKIAARYDVESIVSHEGDLEEAFLAFYSGDTDAA